MTERERVERARRAKMAMDEFFVPAFAVVEQDYAEKMIAVAASTDPRSPEIIARLANGIKVARQVRGLIEAAIHDGQEAQAKLDRAEKLDKLTPSQRRLVSI
jgi:hypothetical protein